MVYIILYHVHTSILVVSHSIKYESKSKTVSGTFASNQVHMRYNISFFP